MSKLFKHKYRYLRVMMLTVIIFLVMFFLNAGFLTDDYWKIIQAFIFAVELAVVIVWPKLKIFVFWQILLLIVVMSVFYVVGILELADMVGSTAFGLMIIIGFSYLPQIVKLGYIKDL